MSLILARNTDVVKAAGFDVFADKAFLKRVYDELLAASRERRAVDHSLFHDVDEEQAARGIAVMRDLLGLLHEPDPEPQAGGGVAEVPFDDGQIPPAQMAA